eukprot:TRINITY_DN1430_c0_g1_i1.p1 TRINITY_DN1430_c0_g1~~TRINITY_DN1430_c0_g1_i1.p1  ORF type:complete len:203 (-),score=49.59 TRINITY_DN1430_c0_g1_i1:575-1183(-)
MPILYVCVANGTKIVSDHGQNKDIKELVSALLSKAGPQKKSYTTHGLSFNHTQSEGYTFLCVASEDHPGRICFAFLAHLQKDFQPSASSRFSSTLKKQMAIYSDAQGVDKIESIKKELDQVKEVMQENIEKVVQRGDQLNDLEDKTLELEGDASLFRGRATKLKTALWYQALRTKIIIGVAIVVIIFIIIWIACGIDFKKCS